MTTETPVEFATMASAIMYMGLLVGAAIHDIISYRIPNTVAVGICGAFVFVGMVFSIGADIWLWHGLGLLAAFSVGVVGWHFRLMGGGDVKLVAALGLWTGVNELASLILTIAVAGGGFTVLLIIVRYGVQRWASQREKLPLILRRGEPVPYGVAIAAGGLLIMPELRMLQPVFRGL